MTQQHGGVNCTQQLPQQLLNGCRAGIVLRHKNYIILILFFLSKPQPETLDRCCSSLTSNPNKRMLEVRHFDAWQEH